MSEIRSPSSTVVIENVPVKRHNTSKRPARYDLSRVVTQPVNQGLCGSCWAISTTQCLRDRTNRFRKKTIPELSFQFVIDCAKNCVSYRGRRGCALNCNGGFLATSFKFLQDVGTPREQYHPNRHANERGEDHIDGASSATASCPRKVDKDEQLYKCDGFYNVHLFDDTFGITNARMKPTFKTPEQLAANAANIAEEIYLNGPVAVCFNLFSDFKAFWMHAKSAQMVYQIGWELPREARASIDPVGSVSWTRATGPYGIHFKTGHSVSIVGYGSQRVYGEPEPVDYWICRNSWGPSPNTYNNGFFKIRRGINASAIEGDVAAPVVLEQSAMALPALAPSGARPAVTPADPFWMQWPFVVLVLVLVGLAVFHWVG